MILERLFGTPKEEISISPGPSKAGKLMLTRLGGSIRAGLSGKIEIELVEEAPQPLQAWLKNLDREDWIIAAPQKEGDPEPLVFALSAAAVSNLTSLAFGAEKPTSLEEHNDGLTGLEIDFLPVLADLLLPAMLGPARTSQIKPLVCSAGKFDLSTVSNAAAAVLQFSLSFEEMTFPLKIASFSERTADRGNADGTSGSEKSASWKAHLSEEIGRSRLSAEAVINLAPQTLAALKALRPGDILPVPEGNLRDCALKARGEPIYSGKLGRQGDVYSFRVCAPARKSSGLMDSIIRGIGRNGTADRSKAR
jgi:Type III flagellar switch regulator (C-ring) FliN C-term